MASYTQDNRLIQVFTPLDKDALLLRSFSGQEGISQPFQFELQMHSENHAIDFKRVVGHGATIQLMMPGGEHRYINGIISAFTQGGTIALGDGKDAVELSEYRGTMVPWLWLLTRTSDSRIFQNLSVPDILEKIFLEYGFTNFEKRLHGTYEPREYCVQYRETDFNFVSRLLEEEGIFYFFEHERYRHVLVLADDPSEIKACEFQPHVDFNSVAGPDVDRQVVSELSVSQEVRTGKYTVKDFNFEQPTLNLTADSAGADERHLEIYDYPAEYRKKGQGERLARIRMEQEDIAVRTVYGSSTCRGFVSGCRSEVRSHHRADLNQPYTLVSLYHSCSQGENYRSNLAQASEAFNYSNSFQAVPHAVHYRPPRRTPVPLVNGSQTAIVVGPKSEEIYTDEYGRVKVQFHWDREGNSDEKSSCWVRVSQNWAGKQWGAIFLPRIGQEVIVHFMEGDPDQPIITGRVYNGESMPPYDLPAEKTKSAIKSCSSEVKKEHDEFRFKDKKGFNEIRFEDKKGSEQLFLHAEKDQDNRVKNDSREFVAAYRHLIVGAHQSERVLGAKHTTVKGGVNEKVDGTVSQRIGADLHQKIAANQALEAGGEIHFKAGTNTVIESGSTLTLKVGESFINIDPTGVYIQGAIVTVNCGGTAGSGGGASPLPPRQPEEADGATPTDGGLSEGYKVSHSDLAISARAKEISKLTGMSETDIKLAMKHFRQEKHWLVQDDELWKKRFDPNPDDEDLFLKIDSGEKLNSEDLRYLKDLMQHELVEAKIIQEQGKELNEAFDKGSLEGKLRKELEAYGYDKAKIDRIVAGTPRPVTPYQYAHNLAEVRGGPNPDPHADSAKRLNPW